MCVTLSQALTCKIDAPLFPLKEKMFTHIFSSFSFSSTLKMPLFVPKAKAVTFCRAKGKGLEKKEEKKS